MPDRRPLPLEDKILVGIFVIALLSHVFLATRNWTAGFMAGHEFRQAQTAITSYYIDRQDNFSLLYETPILGKPWVGLLLEVPVYEWSVVGLSRATGLPHYLAARSVSLACFYLALPAFYLLFGRLGVSRSRRLLPLALILTCPVYIFYSRAFLMESMELMCCAWFLFGFVWMMDRRRWFWFLLATMAGTGAALIKSATLAIWLIPAAAYAAGLLWRDLRARTGWRAPLETVFWGLAGVIVPLGALELWIGLTDPIKAAHASCWIFTSKNLSQGNWGLTDFVGRFSGRTWGILLDRWREAIMPQWLIISGLVIGVICFPQVRGRVLGLAAVFLLAQLLFPFAYAYQDYYFYACAAFLLAAFGLALHGLLDSRLPRGLCWLLVVVVPAAQLHNYWRGYYPSQMVQSNGGFSFTETLRDFLPRESVIIVAGADWAAMIPLYAQHKALMLRNGLEYDRAYLKRALAELADEDVAALVLVEKQRTNLALLQQVRACFDLDRVPTYSHPIADVYCSVRYLPQVRQGLKARGNYGDLIPGPAGPAFDWSKQAFRISDGLARTAFGNVSPAPVRGYFKFGPGHLPFEDGGWALNAHPDCDLWLHAPGGARRIEWEFGIYSNAYEREGDKTDGVAFAVTGELPGGEKRIIFERTLDPVRRPADRGRQREFIPYYPIPGEILHFASRPGQSLNYDWAYWARIDVK
jgi:hypothetical protein